jgi:hypothetical protein
MMNPDVRVGDSLGNRQDNKMPHYDMHQGDLSKRIPATNLRKRIVRAGGMAELGAGREALHGAFKAQARFSTFR